MTPLSATDRARIAQMTVTEKYALIPERGTTGRFFPSDLPAAVDGTVAGSRPGHGDTFQITVIAPGVEGKINLWVRIPDPNHHTGMPWTLGPLPPAPPPHAPDWANHPPTFRTDFNTNFRLEDQTGTFRRVDTTNPLRSMEVTGEVFPAISVSVGEGSVLPVLRDCLAGHLASTLKVDFSTASQLQPSALADYFLSNQVRNIYREGKLWGYSPSALDAYLQELKFQPACHGTRYELGKITSTGGQASRGAAVRIQVSQHAFGVTYSATDGHELQTQRFSLGLDPGGEMGKVFGYFESRIPLYS